jgi:ankyrin repeat protein
LREYVDPDWDEDDGGDEYSSTLDFIQEARSSVLNLLLDDSRVDVNAQDIYGISPLHLAVRGKDTPETTMQRLLEKGAQLFARSNEGETPLHLASQEGNLNAVVTLLQHGADCADPDANGLNALHHAARKGSLDIMRLIVAYIADESRERLLRSTDKNGRNMLHHLAMGNRFGDISTALEHLLQWPHAIGINDLDDEGMSPMARYFSQEILFPSDKDVKSLSLLFDHGADPRFMTRDGLGLVHLAAGSGRLSVSLLRELGSRGVDLGAKDSHGRTALHHSALKGTLEGDVLIFLCTEVGLSLELQDAHGKTQLAYAEEMARVDRDWRIFDGG